MSSRKKNKNKSSKPNTPNPPIHDDIFGETEKGIELKSESENLVKSEERVPEIISEVINPIEQTITETDTPKKPKRNRGKKKQEDKDTDNEFVTESVPEKVVSPLPEMQKCAQKFESASEETKTISTEVQEIMPAARKKKNKNNNQTETKEISDDQEIKIAAPKNKQEFMTDLKIVNLERVTDDSEEGKSKKKNKKKKRLDSEKSEKSEEVISCTAAFQQLLEAKDVKKDDRKQPQEEIAESVQKQKDKTDVIENIEKSKETLDEEQEIPKEENKGKKKNKKDKKRHLKSESDEGHFKSDIEENKTLEETLEVYKKENVAVTSDTKTSTGIKDLSKCTKQKSHKPEKELEKEDVVESTQEENKQLPTFEKKQQKSTSELVDLQSRQHHKSYEEGTPTVEKEKSPNPKAKIAKPVEKKQKGKSGDRSEEFCEQMKIGEMVQTRTEDLEKGRIVQISKSSETQELAKKETMPSTTKSEEIQNFEKTVETKIDIPIEEAKFKVPPEIVKSNEETATATSLSKVKSDSASNIIAEFTQKQHESEKGSKCTANIEPTESTTSVKMVTDKDQNIDNKLQMEHMQVHEEKGKRRRKKSPKPAKMELLQSGIGEYGKKMEQEDKKCEELNKTEETTNKGKGTPECFLPEFVKIQPTTETKSPKVDLAPSASDQAAELVSESASLSSVEELSTPLQPIVEIPNLPKESVVTTKLTSEETPVLLSLVEEPSTPTQPIIEIPNVPKESIVTEPQVQKPTEQKLPVPESGNKKRKKSPKPKKNEKMQAKTNIGVFVEEEAKIELTQDTLENKEKVEKESSENIQTKKETTECHDLPPLEDIEIRSVKTEESDSSICDIVPEVQQPRASSLDTNNNMVICDVSSTEEGKLTLPISSNNSPLIQGSGETPTPGVTFSGITITEVQKTTADDKTDLKSKVIEVNQDMEDLRRSIEVSLAELTAMEKTEEQTEKRFEEAQVKIETIKNLATKEEKNKGDLKKDDTSVTIQLQSTKESETEKGTEVKPIEESKKSKIEQPESAISIENISKPREEQSTDKVSASRVQEMTPAEEEKLEKAAENLSAPPPPPRKENKGRNKKKKGKQEVEHVVSTQTNTSASSPSTAEGSSNVRESKETKEKTQADKKSEKTGDKEGKGKQQSSLSEKSPQDTEIVEFVTGDFQPIANFEDAFTSSETTEDVNKSFEMIANEVSLEDRKNNPEINITAPVEDVEKADANEKVNPVSQPKNLLGHPDIPARLNRTDYKKEKNKTPNTRQAKVKVKDSVPIEVTKQSKESQTENKRKLLKDKTVIETVSSIINDEEEYIYKYSFRRVFLPNACHTCKKDLKFGRSPCTFCNLVFYCGAKHRDEDYPQHQALCFAVSTIAHLKDQKYIYADAQSITGQDYRLLRMQMIISCEKVLKRRLVPWEQEALLYPRICADVHCREWKQGKLVDCEGCGQIAYCSDHPSHLPQSHQRWCKSYNLYQKLVTYQQTQGRLEPKLPKIVMTQDYEIPGKMNEVLASMYEERIDMNDIQYAALTQIATAPLTAAYCQQLYTNHVGSANGLIKKSTFTIHVVGAELQFEADALHKWEVFFLHLRPSVKELRVVLIGLELNPLNLPLDLLAKIKLCETCRQQKRRVVFDFQDKKNYFEYWSTDFITPDLVCAFNPSIQRSSMYNGKDTWPSTIKCITKQKVPFAITSHSLNELSRDLARIKECSDVDLKVISEPKYNPFASVRPDRNFISDDEIPLLFKNFCYMVVCGSF